MVHNVLVGSVSFASPGAKALHNASTAQEITVISPSASQFQITVCNLIHPPHTRLTFDWSDGTIPCRLSVHHITIGTYDHRHRRPPRRGLLALEPPAVRRVQVDPRITAQYSHHYRDRTRSPLIICPINLYGLFSSSIGFPQTAQFFTAQTT